MWVKQKFQILNLFMFDLQDIRHKTPPTKPTCTKFSTSFPKRFTSNN